MSEELFIAAMVQGDAQGMLNHAVQEYHNTPTTAQTANNMGVALQAIGDFDGAARYYRHALALTEGHDHEGHGLLLANLGEIAIATGDGVAAEDLLDRAHAALLQAGPIQALALCAITGNRGCAAKVRGQFTTARQLLLTALDMAYAHRFEPQVAWLRQELATVPTEPINQ